MSTVISSQSVEQDSEQDLRRQDSTHSVFRCLFPSSSDDSQNTDDSQPPLSDVEDDQNAMPAPAVVSNLAAKSPSAEPSTPAESVESDSTPAVPAAVPTPVAPAPVSASATPDDTPVVLYDPAQPSIASPPVNPDTTTPARPANVSPPVDSDATTPAQPADVSPPVDSDATTPAQPADVSPPVDSDATTPAEGADVSLPVDSPSSQRDIMDIEDYFEHKKTGNESRRIVRGTSNPTLWRHRRRPKASLCVLDAVDNGKLLAKTGLLWSIDGKAYQIVLVGSVGWAKPRNTRSSSVNYSNPIYVFLRSATLQGQVFKFDQLKRIVASVLFREGRAHLKVHVPSIHFAEKQAKLFVDKNQRDLDKWDAVPYLTTEVEKLHQQLQAEKLQRLQDAALAKKLKKQKEREETIFKKRQQASLKRAEHLKRRQASLEAKKRARAENQKKTRLIKTQVQSAVMKACKKFEDSIDKSIQDSLSAARAEIDNDISVAISDVRDTLTQTISEFQEELRSRDGQVDEYGVRLNEIESKLEDLKRSWNKFRAYSGKKFKTIEKQVKKLKQHDENENAYQMPPRKRAKQYLWDPDTSVVGRRATPRPPVQTLPISMQSLRHPTMMVNNTRVMYEQPVMSTPQPQPRTVMSTPQPRTVMSTPQQPVAMSASNHNYISPIFGQRNFNIRNI